MKTNQSYLKYFFFGACFGIAVTYAVPKSFADLIGHGITNIFFYGAIGYSILAFKQKEYKKLWNALLIILAGIILLVVVF